MTDLIVNLLLLGGATFMFLAAVGVTRMPDLYMRMSTVTKSATMGAGLLVLAVIVNEGNISVMIKGAMLVLFGFLTSPISGHLLTRAAYIRRIPLWDMSVADELQGRYEKASHALRSPKQEEDLVADSFLPDDPNRDIPK